MNIADAAPGIFSGGVLHANGQAVSSSFPAKTGEIVVVYAAGLGPVDTRLQAGQVTPSAPLGRALTIVTAEVGGISVVPEFAGLTPSYVGLYQVNVKIPSSLQTGVYNLRLLTRGNISNPVPVPVTR